MKTYFKNNLLWILTVFLFIGCEKNEIKPLAAYFIGEIINPSSDSVLLYSDNKVIDTLKLSIDKRFFKKFDSINYGLFKMEHLPEKQMLIIESGDSILSRANMSDFNGSLFFSGRGAAKNNFLMEIYLKLQEEISFLSSKYSLSGKSFNQIIDSLQREKYINWKKLIEKNNFSNFSKKITEASFIYPYANRKARYALIRGKSKNIKTDSSYFNYRGKLNYNDEELSFFEPYISYLMSYLSLEALEKDETFYLAKNKTNFNIKRIEVIEKEIKNIKLKNILARAVAYEEIMNFNNQISHEKFLKSYSLINPNQEYFNEIIGLNKSLMQMRAGRPLPIVLLENNVGQIITSNKAFMGQKTVLYFWSQTQMNHFKRNEERAKVYKEKFPNYRFVGISIQPYNQLVRNYQEIMNIDIKDQLALVNYQTSTSDWVINLLNKGIILDKNCLILEGFGNFGYEKSFENLLRKHYKIN
ncbi:MAG: hypothetical protein ACJ0PY_00255 [Flavobacteriaceae bacterium]|tara:strand:- start:2012 stop:3421 length:1410 start_codon:yes stop_codon:yes gene_type:complete